MPKAYMAVKAQQLIKINSRTSQITVHELSRLITRFTAKALYLSSVGATLDPHVYILLKRIVALRLLLLKWPDYLETCCNILQLCKELDFVGIFHDEEHLNQRTAAPPPEASGGSPWIPTMDPVGPMGLLLATLHLFACALDINELIVRKADFVYARLTTMPIQAIRSIVLQMGSATIYDHARNTRSGLVNTPCIDPFIFERAMAKADKEHVNIVRATATLSIVDSNYMHRFDPSHPSECVFCGTAHDTFDGFIWGCQHSVVKAARINTEDSLEQALIEIAEHLPASLRNGIPPAMNKKPDMACWCSSDDDQAWKNGINNTQRDQLGIGGYKHASIINSMSGSICCQTLVSTMYSDSLTTLLSLLQIWNYLLLLKVASQSIQISIVMDRSFSERAMNYRWPQQQDSGPIGENKS